MALVSLTEMRARTRQLAGQETSLPASAHVDTDENDLGINEALSAFHDLMIELQRHEWVVTPVKTHSDTLVTGTTSYPLPDKLLATVSVRLSDGTTSHYVRPWDHADRDWLSNSSVPYIDGYHYRVIGRMLELLPSPRAGYTLLVDYVPEYSPLVNPAETFECPFGWWRWAAIKAAIGMAYKGHTETKQLADDWQFEDRRIRSLAGKRGTRGLRIVNTRRRGGMMRHLSRLWRDA